MAIEATQKEINALILQIRRMSKEVQKKAIDDLKDSAELMSNAIRVRVPVSPKSHSRYKRVAKSGRRMPKGYGVKAATYRPGNLRKSFRRLSLRRMKTAVMVGPLLGGKTIDGYYAHFVNDDVKMTNGKIRVGKKFVDAAVSAMGPTTLNNMVNSLRLRVEMEAKKQGL
jgi:hypothetical protein